MQGLGESPDGVDRAPVRTLWGGGELTDKVEVGPRREKNAGGAGPRGVRQFKQVAFDGEIHVCRCNGKSLEGGIRPNPSGKDSHLAVVLRLCGSCKGEVQQGLEGRWGC